MYCIKKLTDDVLFNCQNKSVKGLEKRILLLNYLDIDRKATILNESKTTIEKLVLKEGKKAYLFQGTNKSFVGNQKYSKKFQQEISLQIYQVDERTLKRIDELTKSTLVVIVETKNKGQNGENAFEILGFDAGLQLSDLQRDYNKTSIKLTLTTNPQIKELRMVYKWIETNYRNTLNKFDSKLNDIKTLKIFDETFDNTFE